MTLQCQPDSLQQCTRDMFSSGQCPQRLWTRSIRSAPRRAEMCAAPRQVNLFERYTEQVQQPFALFTCTLHGRAGGGLPPPAAHAELHVHLHLGMLRRALHWVRFPHASALRLQPGLSLQAQHPQPSPPSRHSNAQKQIVPRTAQPSFIRICV